MSSASKRAPSPLEVFVNAFFARWHFSPPFPGVLWRAVEDGQVFAPTFVWTRPPLTCWLSQESDAMQGNCFRRKLVVTQFKSSTPRSESNTPQSIQYRIVKVVRLRFHCSSERVSIAFFQQRSPRMITRSIFTRGSASNPPNHWGSINEPALQARLHVCIPLRPPRSDLPLSCQPTAMPGALECPYYPFTIIKMNQPLCTEKQFFYLVSSRLYLNPWLHPTNLNWNTP